LCRLRDKNKLAQKIDFIKHPLNSSSEIYYSEKELKERANES